MENLYSYHYDPRSRGRIVFTTCATGALAALYALQPSYMALSLFGGAVLGWTSLLPMLRGCRAGSKITPTRLTYYHRPREGAAEESRSFLLGHIHSLRIDPQSRQVRLTDTIGDWHDLPLIAFPAADTLGLWLDRSGIRLEVGPLPCPDTPLPA